MNTVIIATIGMRDLQYVYTANDNKFRTPVKNPNDYTDRIDKYYLLPYEDFEEIEVRDTSGLDIISIAIPMLQKAFDFAHARGVTKIDKLILLPTKRDKLATQLKELPIKITDPVKRDKMEKHIEQRKLLSYAENDYSFKSAEKIKLLLTKHKENIPLTISSIEILPLGENGFLDKLFSSAESITTSDLDRADINTSDFFDYELIEAIKPKLAELNGSCIYLASFSGGLPTMQKSLTKVLQSLLVSPLLIPVHGSEKGGYLELQNPQDEFLSLHKHMNQSAIEMDWESVKDLFNKIGTVKPDYYLQPTKDKMKTLLNDIAEAQKAPGRWFSNFFVLILRALYRQDYNNLLIWIKAMQEAAWFGLLKTGETDCGYSLVLDDKTKHSQDRDYLIFADGSSISINFTDVISKFRQSKAKSFLTDYHKLFYNDKATYNADRGSSEYYFNPRFEKIRDRRNQLIHKGIPLQKTDDLVNSMLTFIGTTSGALKQAILDLKNSKCEKVSEFEQNLLCNSDFFGILKQIDGMTTEDWLPVERTLLKEYIELINGNIVTASV